MLLFVNKWKRPDIHLRAPFLCTGVKSSALQDHTQIGRVIGNLKILFNYFLYQEQIVMET